MSKRSFDCLMLSPETFFPSLYHVISVLLVSEEQSKLTLSPTLIVLFLGTRSNLGRAVNHTTHVYLLNCGWFLRSRCRSNIMKRTIIVAGQTKKTCNGETFAVTQTLRGLVTPLATTLTRSCYCANQLMINSTSVTYSFSLGIVLAFTGFREPLARCWRARVVAVNRFRKSINKLFTKRIAIITPGGNKGSSLNYNPMQRDHDGESAG